MYTCKSEWWHSHSPHQWLHSCHIFKLANVELGEGCSGAYCDVHLNIVHIRKWRKRCIVSTILLSRMVGSHLDRLITVSSGDKVYSMSCPFCQVYSEIKCPIRHYLGYIISLFTFWLYIRPELCLFHHSSKNRYHQLYPYHTYVAERLATGFYPGSIYMLCFAP